jgi:outer membrane receptor protein involved in Fe transport
MGYPKYRSLAGGLATAALLSLTISAANLAAAAASTASAAAATRTSDNASHQEVVATANKRVEGIKDVPMNFDIARSVPGVNFNSVFEDYTVHPLTVGITIKAHFDRAGKV